MSWREMRVTVLASRLSRLLPHRFRRDDKGTTAVEFGMVAVPFMMMLFGIIAIGLYFHTVFALENAVERASRQFRTGQAQQANLTPDQFKTSLCTYLPSNIACDAKLQVNVKSYPDSASITNASLPQCRTGGNALNTTTEYNAGGANVIYLVWVCYKWDLAAKLPYLTFPGALADNSLLIQAATTFKTEPYTN